MKFVSHFVLIYKNYFIGIQENISLTLDDVQFIIKITEPLKVNGKYRRGAFYVQKFLFGLFLFYKRKRTSLLFLPFKTVARLNGSSKKTASRNIKFCEKYGILKLEGKADIEQHKSRRYYLNYKFQPGKKVESFELGVFLIFDLSQLFREYSRGIYERISKI